ncbi:MAG: ECF transporter S component [Thermoflexales bacterium]|nr:ECF transporter S component [Thermoflexales bacterium]MCS7324179.1 ECF transporter S component [Thermoflexales bacterium]MDW8053256.1 ECF transporter S component [Anaerolineae bacterium]MDW8291907.1 ECF transporter S component [Anaerolineae bacterium]
MLTRSNPWTLDSRTTVLAAIFAAMVIALQLIGLGSIPVPNISGSMTTLHLPVILGAVIGGPIVGMFAGVVMGVIYLLLPATAAFGPITLVVPRPIFALAAWATFNVLRRLGTAPAALGAGIIGALTNTVVTVGIALLLGQVPLEVVPVILPQAGIELIATAVIVPIITLAVEAALKSQQR